MKSTTAFFTTLLLAFSASQVIASALTTTIPANDRTCFYAAVDKPGEKVRYRVFALLWLCPECGFRLAFTLLSRVEARECYIFV